jgi:hypothetical protein
VFLRISVPIRSSFVRKCGCFHPNSGRLPCFAGRIIGVPRPNGHLFQPLWDLLVLILRGFILL